ncbi:HpcH/HpaI aldolase/citrate lyase family protein [Amycolatopsis acidiphila]|uniref:HpcH/HpaI aldolase/citrate lyase family protein n=1 Tax=Amycolatopsis acidiphila TaxID=715473 RepID=A0A558AP42_9PSEU|nr:HpcH/HpaI aldolase/citrate lyase family protein [Amycolatopsis acidiphila]TVT26024.1 HpcH/HpaI aldolase/citrate lyase family protein [Amycolatopsis acidiphila]UIJ63261.1 HpcH/HpaI aldolase/citrate lyase family protein [Amycolatopsis acidiphila]GHG74661.1 2,4-dihydroxyhept-2-ene-1,7-dioic acid aldolase [Amycolatopsis acidiphila]
MSWGERLRGGEPLFGMWVVSGSAYNAEICAGGGLDCLVFDGEHAPNDVPSLVPQLQAVAPYPVEVLVRPPVGDAVLVKQLLDIGVRNLLVPMVETAEQARGLVSAMRYPPDGIRGVGGAFARASGWGRVPGYLAHAAEDLTLTVQVESRRGLEEVKAIAAVDGVDAVFLGPADLAASLGHLGEPEHPEVLAAVEEAIGTVAASGKAACVNAFAEPTARRYLAAGARFVVVGADVTLLARGSEALASRYRAK